MICIVPETLDIPAPGPYSGATNTRLYAVRLCEVLWICENNLNEMFDCTQEHVATLTVFY